MAHMGGREGCIQDFGGGNPREGDLLEDFGVDGRIILKLTLKKWGGEEMTGFALAEGQVASGNEPSGSIKCGKYLD